VSKWYLYSLMALMLFFGTCNTVLMKMQDDTVVGSAGQKFNHPYFQCAVMFVGEFACLVMYGAKRMMYPQMQGHGSFNPLWVAIPAGFDICGSTMMFIALTMCAASVYQMMRGFIVVITAFMALMFLGRKQFAHHWISLFTIVLGVAVVGWVNIMASSSADSAA